MLLKDRIARELEKIQRKTNGLLTAEAVVEYAQAHPDSALHTQFEWDDTAAARKWRLEQAGQIIRLQVKVIAENTAPIRAFVSLSSDRKARAGYRSVEDVLTDAELSKQMLADALDDLNSVRRKYGNLKQLAGVWRAIDEVKVDGVVEESRPAA